MEVITLQCGHFANHVGAHFWNLQDEAAAQEDSAADEDESLVDHTRLFQAAESHGQLSWRPRVLLVDRGGALGAVAPLKELNVEEPTAAGEAAWNVGVDILRAAPVSKHPYIEDLDMEEEGAEDMEVEQEGPATSSAAKYDFRNTSRTWTDFLKVRLPDSCVHELQHVHHGVTPFPLYFEGLQVRGREEEEVILDKVRRQVELCSLPDALQVVYDMHDGFGGITDLVLRWGREELPKAGKFVLAALPESSEPSRLPHGRFTPDFSWCAPVEDEPTSTLELDYEACSWISAAFSFANILNSDPHAFVPCPVPLWSIPKSLPKLQKHSSYEAGALIASALDNALLPGRQRGGPRPSEFIGALAPYQRPVCGILQALPVPDAPMEVPGQAPGSGDTLASMASHLFDLTSMPALPLNPYTSVVLRGTEGRRLLNLTRTLPPRARRQSYLHPSRMLLPVPFPQVFAPDISKDGVCGSERAEGEEVERATSLTQLHAAAGAGRCQALRCMANALRQHQRSAWAAAVRTRYDVEADEFRDVLEVVTDHLESSAADETEEEELSSEG